MNDIQPLQRPLYVKAVNAPAPKLPLAILNELPQDQFEQGAPAAIATASPALAQTPARPVQAAPAPVTTVVTSVPQTLQQEEYAPTTVRAPLRTGDLGPGFPAAPAEKETTAQQLQTFLSTKLKGPYGWGVTKLLDRISEVTSKGVGVDVSGLLSVEKMLYQSLAPSDDGYGGAPPLFVALANGKTAYVNLGPNRTSDADHLMRMFEGLPLSTIDRMGKGDDDLSKVRQVLLDRAKAGDFPVYIDMDGKFGEPSSTESIATESIASIAKRENHLGADFPDPRTYYKWLVTRVDSAYRKLDPWMFGTNPDTHKSSDLIKTALTPPWISPEKSNDPFGYSPSPKQTQAAYKEMMKVCGDGQPPTWDTFANIADTAVSMDRDLISGIQTYWIKMFREISPEQRESLMTPVAKAWVDLNTVAPDDSGYAKVSPENAPYIDLVEKGSGNLVQERYDRAMALSQAVGHTLDGLGIAERRQFLDQIVDEARSKQNLIQDRETRLREALGPAYHGLDVAGILSGHKSLSDPGVIQGLADLKAAAQPADGGHCEMNALHADVIRQLDMLHFIAGRYENYGDIAFKGVYHHCKATEEFAGKPLILSEFYTPDVKGGPVTPLPAGPCKTYLLGKPVDGQQPVKASVGFKGGGGKGEAYPQALSDTFAALAQGTGQIAVDEFYGNSAGAITAGFLAAGYSPDEMGELTKQLDFKKFYGDYMWLEGGVDPKVRGIDRTGLFSQQKMYNVLEGLLKDKVPVAGRPVLFRDLPFKLKVTSTMLNSDLPDNMKKDLNIAADGQIVFSSENTPNMDVAAALCCSSAVPGFFNAPQIQLCEQSDRSGNPQMQRMQLVDGGTVNNFPIAQAGDKADKSFLVVLSTYFTAPSATPGAPDVSLSTLDFDSGHLPEINAFNHEQYKAITPALAATVQKVAAQGYDRAILAFDLADASDHKEPILQGRSRAQTQDILKIADQTGLPHLQAQAGADVLNNDLDAKKPNLAEQILLNEFLGKDGTFKPGILHAPQYKPGDHEATGISDLIAGVIGAHFTAPYHLQDWLFEKA